MPINETQSEVLVRGRWVITGSEPSDPVISDGALSVIKGRIGEIGPWKVMRDNHPEARVVGSEHTAVLPGLINAHHHSAGVSYLQHGVADDLLEPWILSLHRLRQTDPHLNVLLSAARLLGSGVTSVVEVHSSSATPEQYQSSLEQELKAYERSGMRVAFATGVSTQSHLIAGEDQQFIDSLPEELKADAQHLMPAAGKVTADEYLSIVDESRRKYVNDPLIDVWFAPPGPQWVSDELMQSIAEQADSSDCGIQTHVTESFYEKMYGPRTYGKDTMLHLRDLDVLSPRFSIAHGVWLTEAEIDAMSETGAALSHNPGSNLRLRAGIAPLNDLRAAGVTLGLGMDGTTLNDDEDMFAEMRLAMRLHRTPQLRTPAPTPAEIFGMATTGGAKLLRKETELGRIAPGFLADIVLLDTERVCWPWVAPEADARELILMRAQSRDVETVLVNGEIVWQDGEPTRFNRQDAGRALGELLAGTDYPNRMGTACDRLNQSVQDYYLDWAMPDLEPFTVYNSRR